MSESRWFSLGWRVQTRLITRAVSTSRCPWPLQLTVALFLSGASNGALAEQEGECFGAEQVLIENLRTADAVFFGLIKIAEMKSSESNEIALCFAVTQPIRGAEEGSEHCAITTNDERGIPARLGGGAVLAVHEGNSQVVLCENAVHPYSPNWQHLLPALIVVEFLESDRGRVTKALRNANLYQTRDEFMTFFRLLEGLDPGADIEYSESTIRYRNLQFGFGSNKVSFTWIDSDE